VKSFFVTPLICSVVPTPTETPVVVKVAARWATSMPQGTPTAMVALVWSMTPETAGEAKPKAVMSFAGDGPASRVTAMV
jgi:hypothetical protein